MKKTMFLLMIGFSTKFTFAQNGELVPMERIYLSEDGARASNELDRFYAGPIPGLEDLQRPNDILVAVTYPGNPPLAAIGFLHGSSAGRFCSAIQWTSKYIYTHANCVKKFIEGTGTTYFKRQQSNSPGSEWQSYEVVYGAYYGSIGLMRLGELVYGRTLDNMHSMGDPSYYLYDKGWVIRGIGLYRGETNLWQQDGCKFTLTTNSASVKLECSDYISYKAGAPILGYLGNKWRLVGFSNGSGRISLIRSSEDKGLLRYFPDLMDQWKDSTRYNLSPVQPTVEPQLPPWMR